MQTIKQHVSECLALKPKLNSLVELLGILHTTKKIKEKTFCARQLTRIFKCYNSQSLLASQVGVFIRDKLSSFVQLLKILSPLDPIFIECIDELIHIANPHDIVTTGRSDEGFWGRITNANTATQLIGTVMTSPCLQRLRCLLELPATMLYVSPQQQNKTQLKREATEQQETNKQVQSRFKKSYQNLLFSVLKDEQLLEADRRTIIKSLGQKIFSKIESPLIISEFILKTFKSTDDLEVKIDLLSALFVLIGRYGLEIQDFYGQLYQLLTAKNQNGITVYEVSNSKRVFKMLQNCLRSSKVPFNTIVKFLKCLLQQCMANNSQFVCWVLALIFNLFKKHTLLRNCLDPNSELYLPQFQSLQNHYLPQVKSIVARLNKNLTKQDFLDISQFTSINLQKVLKHQLDTLIISYIEVPSHVNNLLQM